MAICLCGGVEGLDGGIGVCVDFVGVCVHARVYTHTHIHTRMYCVVTKGHTKKQIRSTLWINSHFFDAELKRNSVISKKPTSIHMVFVKVTQVCQK